MGVIGMEPASDVLEGDQPDGDRAGEGRTGRAHTALEELYKTSYPRLVHAAFAVLGDLGDAQDVAQEAFERAIAKPRKVLAADHPEAWLRVVVVNLARNRRRRRNWMDRFLRRTPTESDQPSDIDRIAILVALKQLSPILRETVGLHYLADFSVAEIATTLRVPDGTVKARLARGRAALAKLLTVEERDDE